MPESKRKRVPPRRAAGQRTPARPARPAGLLAVDVGNSDTVVGLFIGPELTGFWRFTSRPETADELSLRLEALSRAHRWPRSLSAVLCSVAPALTLPWAGALGRLAGDPPVEVSASTAHGLPIRYHDRTAVGADRIANAVAARALYGTPAIVVDLGTATTFDVVGKRGDYLGGAIAPGVVTASEELFRRAARLTRVELEIPARAIGRTTTESLQSGILLGTAGLVDALVRRITRELGAKPHVIATGGLGALIAPACETIQVVDEWLTLHGLRLIHEQARARRRRHAT